MGKSKPQGWKLNPNEVNWGMNNSSSGKTGQFARKLKITSTLMFLEHLPTKIKVEGEIPSGNYSKKEMQKLRKELEATLFNKLERLVAQKLKVKGR